MDTIVAFQNVQKSYDGRNFVAKDLDLEIERGEFLSLLGPSGSGKTTTLMMLAGFEEPSSGQIIYNGIPLSGIPPFRRGMGVVFQNYALFPHMSVSRNIGYPLVMRGMPKHEIARKVADVSKLVGLADLGERRPSQLSGGQQQRVALARALVFEPPMILMDEPLGALDKQLREQMQFELKRLHRQLGVTIVFVTHDQGEALTMSDRIAVFNEGRIQQIDTPTGVYEHPANQFVAGFVGENNWLKGSVEAASDAKCIVKTDAGDRIETAPDKTMRAGQRCLVAIRPERLLVGRAGADVPNKLIGTVRQKSFGGDHLRIEVELADRSVLVAKAPAWKVDQYIVEGGQATLGWATDHGQLLAATPSS